MTIHDFLIDNVEADISDAFLSSIENELGANFQAEKTDDDRQLVFRALARIYLNLATRPNVSEGGVSISYNASDKKLFLDLANKYATLGGEPNLIPRVKYGYKGQSV